MLTNIRKDKNEGVLRRQVEVMGRWRELLCFLEFERWEEKLSFPVWGGVRSEERGKVKILVRESTKLKKVGSGNSAMLLILLPISIKGE